MHSIEDLLTIALHGELVQLVREIEEKKYEFALLQDPEQIFELINPYTIETE